MTHRVRVDFDRARTNVEDGVHAVEIGDDSNASHFAEDAKAAFDGVPSELPYVEEYRTALNDHNFEEAFEALANFASYVEAGEVEEYDLQYQSSALDRIQDSYRRHFE